MNSGSGIWARIKRIEGLARPWQNGESAPVREKQEALDRIVGEARGLIREAELLRSFLGVVGHGE